MSAGVYILHFDPPFKHAKHYIGYADDLDRRIAEHVSGKGANLTRHAVAAGCQLTVVATFPGKDRRFERKLHNRKSTPRMCPICRQAHAEHEHAQLPALAS